MLQLTKAVQDCGENAVKTCLRVSLENHVSQSEELQRHRKQ